MSVTPKRNLYCCECRSDSLARLTDGAEIYPHRQDLKSLPFWKCETCGNYVSCRRGTTLPLGVIPTPELRDARRHIHNVIDPIWKSGEMDRTELYAALSKELGYTYHTAEIRTLEEARKIWRIATNLSNGRRKGDQVAAPAQRKREEELLFQLKRLEKAAARIGNFDRVPNYHRKQSDWTRLHAAVTTARETIKQFEESTDAVA